jgi:hypothetical protein
MRMTSCRGSGSRKAIALLAGLIVLGAATVGVSQPGADEAPPKPLPEGLRHVPIDAMGFVHFRIGDFLKSDIGKTLATQLMRHPDTAKTVQAMERELGVQISDLESVTLLLLEPAFLDMLGGRAFQAGGMGGGIMRSAPFVESALPPIVEKAIPLTPPPIPPKEGPKDAPKEPAKPEAPFGFEESPVSLQAEFIQRDIEELMMLNLDHSGWGPLVILTTTKPVDRKALLRRFVLPEQRPDQRPDQRLDGLVHRGEMSVLFLSDRAFLVGSPMEIWRYSDAVGKERPGAGKGGFAKGPFGKGGAGAPAAAAVTRTTLRRARALGHEPHLILAGGQFSGLKNLMLLGGARGMGPGAGAEVGLAATLFPLLNVSSAALTLDLDRTADLKIHFHGANLKSATLAAEAAKTGLTLLDLGIERLLEDKTALAPDDPGFPLVAELLKKTRAAVAAATVKQDETTVLVQLRGEINAKTLSQAVTAVVGEVKKASDRTMRTNNLKQIGLALHSYHDVMKGLPPAALSSVKNRDGKPLLSWRVAILPYIEQAPLYQQFDLELPWDHPHNKKLIDKMPEIYVLPGIKTKDPGLTHYQVLVGPGTAFERRKGQTLTGTRLVEMHDGTSNTIMVVEAAEPVIWTKPDDVPYDPKQPVPKLGPFRDGFFVALCDGSTRFIRRTVNEQTLRALITRNGGEVVPGDF